MLPFEKSDSTPFLYNDFCIFTLLANACSGYLSPKTVMNRDTTVTDKTF